MSGSSNQWWDYSVGQHNDEADGGDGGGGGVGGGEGARAFTFFPQNTSTSTSTSNNHTNLPNYSQTSTLDSSIPFHQTVQPSLTPNFPPAGAPPLNSRPDRHLLGFHTRQPPISLFNNIPSPGLFDPDTSQSGGEPVFSLPEPQTDFQLPILPQPVFSGLTFSPTFSNATEPSSLRNIRSAISYRTSFPHLPGSHATPRAAIPTSARAPIATSAPSDVMDEERAAKRRRVSTGTGASSSRAQEPLKAETPNVETLDEVEEVDLTEVNSTSELAATLAKQQEEAVTAQNKAAGSSLSGRTSLTSYKCPVCMDTPEDATTTICGKSSSKSRVGFCKSDLSP